MRSSMFFLHLIHNTKNVHFVLFPIENTVSCFIMDGYFKNQTFCNSISSIYHEGFLSYTKLMFRLIES